MNQEPLCLKSIHLTIEDEGKSFHGLAVLASLPLSTILLDQRGFESTLTHNVISCASLDSWCRICAIFTLCFDCLTTVDNLLTLYLSALLTKISPSFIKDVLWS